MISFLETGRRMTSQRWARALTDALTYQWKLLDAHYQTGLTMMETVLNVPAPVLPTPAARPAERPLKGNGKPEPQPREPRKGIGAIANKIAVVTGAAGGIGEAVARLLVRRGAGAVAVVDRSDRAVEVACSINDAAGRAVASAHVGDTTSDAFRTRVFDEMGARHGVVDICVPAAGIARDALAVKVDKTTGKASIYPAETFRQVVEVNLIAPVYWALEMVARIAEDRRRRGLGRWEPTEEVQGSVVFIGSVSSQGNKGQLSYAATKAALEGAAATLTKEAIFHGVKCCVIHPGFTDTPMVRALGEQYIARNILPYTQLRRLIRPDEIADAICFLIANSAISGELWADAGWHPSA
jgi:NAD(P)-dependent dehydrogenase (short-subunit alcohol dehydrogenase family)